MINLINYQENKIRNISINKNNKTYLKITK